MFTERSILRTAIAAAMLACPALLSARGAAQAHPASAPQAATTSDGGQQQPESGAEQVSGAAAEDPLRIFRAPLLREGSSLVEAVAHLKRDDGQGWWVLEVRPPDPSLPPYDLAVLPCTRLTEMERIIETMPGDVAFKVTGRVFVFRDRNYILPSHAAVISGLTTATTPAATAPASTAPSAAPSTAPSTSPAASAPATMAATSPVRPPMGDSAESIMRQLEMQSGPVARSSGVAASAAHPASAPSSASSSSSRRSASAPAAATTTRSAIAGAGIQENTAVINRRGKITRDRGGGWLLVFDADAAGLADPPLKLLPCMLLESIEDYARRVGNNSPIIVTGQVYLYNGQNYLLPTVYRIPRESTRITP